MNQLIPKIILISSIFSLYNHQTFGQKKLNFYVDAAPLYSYRDYSMGKATKDSDGEWHKLHFEEVRNHLDTTESPALGMEFNAGIEYSVSQKLSIRTGLGYKRIGQRTVLFSYATYFPGVAIEEQHTLNKFYQYLVLPVKVQYQLVKLSEKFDIEFSIGSSINFLIGENFYHDRAYHNYPNKIAVDMNSGLLFNFFVGDNITIYLMPEFTGYVTPNLEYQELLHNVKSFQINQHQYHAQLKFGVEF